MMVSACLMVLRVMLDHHYGISPVPQFQQHPNEFRIVVRVQTDGRLIQYINHPDQSHAQLSGQAHPLGFAAAQSAVFTIQVEVTQAHFMDKPQTSAPGL